jgi:hypothetical protein
MLLLFPAEAQRRPEYFILTNLWVIPLYPGAVISALTIRDHYDPQVMAA